MAIYLKTKDNKIYRSRQAKQDYILCTPWENGEDRRKQAEDLSDAIKINREKALFEINERWRNTNFKWSFNNKKYESRGTIDLAPDHEFSHIHQRVNANGEIVVSTWKNKYKLAFYQGKLIWVCPYSQYYPQVYYYEFENIDTEPTSYNKWTNIKCIKPIFCVTDKKFI